MRAAQRGPGRTQGRDDLHLLPVISKFFAAIQAHHVSPRNSAHNRALFQDFAADGKAVMPVTTTEEYIPQSREQIPENREHILPPGRDAKTAGVAHKTFQLLRFSSGIKGS